MGGLAQRRYERSEHIWRCFYKHHPDLVCVEVAIVLAQDEPDELRDRACHLDAGRSSADDGKSQLPATQLRVLRPARGFELGKDPIADGETLVQVLEAHGLLGEVEVAEVVALRTGGQDQVVVPERTVVCEHAPGLEVDAGDHSLQEVRVVNRAYELAHRTRDLTGIEQRSRDLVEQRREQVVVVAVDERDVDGSAPKRARAGQPAEARAGDDDPRSFLTPADCAVPSAAGSAYHRCGGGSPSSPAPSFPRSPRAETSAASASS